MLIKILSLLLTLLIAQVAWAEIGPVSCYSVTSNEFCTSGWLRVYADLSTDEVGAEVYCLDPETNWMLQTKELRERFFGLNGIATAEFYKQNEAICPEKSGCFSEGVSMSAADALRHMCIR